MRQVNTAFPSGLTIGAPCTIGRDNYTILKVRPLFTDNTESQRYAITVRKAASSIAYVAYLEADGRVSRLLPLTSI